MLLAFIAFGYAAFIAVGYTAIGFPPTFKGSEDTFWKDGQLLPEHLEKVAKMNPRLQLSFHMRNGYDHGYYFISTFVDAHLEFHAKHLK